MTEGLIVCVILWIVTALLIWKFFYRKPLFEKIPSEENEASMAQGQKTKMMLLTKILIIGVTISSIGLYFFPPERVIRKSCMKKLKLKSESDSYFTRSDANKFYRTCLAQHGMKPEDLY